MKVRIPQQPSRAEMMQKLQEFQENSEKKQEELNNREYEIEAGPVTVKIRGDKQLTALSLDPDVIKDAAEEPEMLEDLIITAVNRALEQVEKTNTEEMEALTAGLNLPNIPGL